MVIAACGHCCRSSAFDGRSDSTAPQPRRPRYLARTRQLDDFAIPLSPPSGRRGRHRPWLPRRSEHFHATLSPSMMLEGAAAVDDAGTMRRGRRRHRSRSGVPPMGRTVPRRAERGVFREGLHHHEVERTFRRDVVDGRDVRVVQRGCGSGVPLKAPLVVSIRDLFGLENPEGDEPGSACRGPCKSHPYRHRRSAPPLRSGAICARKAACLVCSHDMRPVTAGQYGVWGGASSMPKGGACPEACHTFVVSIATILGPRCPISIRHRSRVAAHGRSPRRAVRSVL